MSAAPSVSVLLPVRNGAATIERAVASIRVQTFRDWELVVVDDGSTDGTADAVEAWARDDARVRLIASEGNGIVAALNTGLAAARGEFIARMDADDESHSGRFAAQVAFLRECGNRDIGLVGCRVEFGGDRATREGYALHVDWINALLTPEEIALNRFVESPFAHPSVMFRRELVPRHGGYQAGDFPEDYELWLRWLDAGVRMAKVPRALLRWNDPPTRSSRNDSRYDPEAFFRVKAGWIARAVWEIQDAPEVYIWGAGRPTRKRAGALEAHGLKIVGYIDVDPKKATDALGGTGVPVLGERDVPPPEEAFVLGYVSSRGARELIRGKLNARGYREGLDFLMCA